MKVWHNIIYVKVHADRIELRHIESGQREVLVPSEPFTSHRLLIGNFDSAENILREGLRKLSGGRWIGLGPIVVIQPMEKTEFGLSQVEDRVLREVAIGAGARKVSVWVGRVLSDDEAIAEARRA